MSDLYACNPDSEDNECRFAVLTDLHIAHTHDARLAYLRAVLDAMRSLTHSPHFVVLTGDLLNATKQDTQSVWHDVDQLLKRLSCPYYVLRGNTDLSMPAQHFVFTDHGWLFVGIDTAEETISPDEDRWLQGILDEHANLPAVLLAHHYPQALDPTGYERICTRLTASHVKHLICGHGHRTEQWCLMETAIHLVAAADPFKPSSEQPGFEMFSLQGDDLRRSRHPVSLIRNEDFVKLIYNTGSALQAELLDNGLPRVCGRCRTDCVQIKKPQPGIGIKTVQHHTEQGWLRSVSLHASTPHIDLDGTLTNRQQLMDELAIAQAVQAVSITTHLPTWDASVVFDGSDRMQDNEPATRLLEALADTWSSYWQSGIRIDIENTHWYDPALAPKAHGEQQLGIRPAHLLEIALRIEERIRARCGGVPGSGLAFCLDVGHVMTNGPLIDRFGLTDWFELLSGRIASIHLHDVVVQADGHRQGHHRLGVDGGILNLEAFAYLWTRHASEAPVYLEVQTIEAVEASVDHLREWFTNRTNTHALNPMARKETG